MKPTSERMLKTATERRIRTPAIWTILKDYAAEVKEIEDMLRQARKAIASLDEEALGTVPDSLDYGYGWPIRDELLSRIDSVVQKEKA